MARLSSIGLLVSLFLLRSAAGDDSRETFFELKVRPVLAMKCLPCHGGKKTNSGLRVDSREALLRGGDRGPAIVPGKPAKSLLIQAVRQIDDDLKMPPDRRLPDEATTALAEWIAAGAAWPKEATKQPATGDGGAVHWAFKRVKVALPPPDPSGWSTAAIDRFVAEGRRAAGLSPARRADRRTLIRRVTFDLTGLPPTPEEISDFLADRSPSAFSHVVDRLLASPHHGERWGRHWMDVVRYADTAGDNADYPIPEAARYRDYIIDSFNSDKPYDQIIREHLAGDLLARRAPPARYAESVIATGFLALSRRYATAPFELWHLTLEDTIDTTGRAFLGLTLRCARCHDHKFDPVTQRDYYALYGIFASTTFPYAGSEELQSKSFPRMNFVPTLHWAEAQAKLERYQKRLTELDREAKALESKSDTSSKSRGEKLRAEWSNLRRASLPADVPGSYAVSEGKPVDVPLQHRGDPDSPGAIVPRGVPQFPFLAAEAATDVASGSSGRLELALWLTHPDHPLTARVMANRIWQHHFGRGIVATPSNFGVRGEPPSHPELLDWLAAKFVAGGWSIKDMHREIVLSQTYQLSSENDSPYVARDPDNRWLWRFPVRRLDAESIRDAMLVVSGRLERRRPGPQPFPPIEAWHWTQHNPFKAVYPSRHRSVYLMTQRLVKHPFMAIFDGPDTNASTDLRPRSTVPLQALYLRNNPFVQEQAAGFADRLIASDSETQARIRRAYDLAWGRPPEADEIDRWIRYLKDCRGALAAAQISQAAIEREAWSSLAKVMLTSNEFLYID
jgi:Protein of unknown function (DUF1553)/Protein of unknown function (DUF1549)/Planctomycete cytochrome C